MLSSLFFGLFVPAVQQLFIKVIFLVLRTGIEAVPQVLDATLATVYTICCRYVFIDCSLMNSYANYAV